MAVLRKLREQAYGLLGMVPEKRQLKAEIAPPNFKEKDIDRNRDEIFEGQTDTYYIERELLPKKAKLVLTSTVLGEAVALGVGLGAEAQNYSNLKLLSYAAMAAGGAWLLGNIFLEETATPLVRYLDRENLLHYTNLYNEALNEPCLPGIKTKTPSRIAAPA